jgi:predicted CxxxxCH...CXXCH cytochrome family protein
MSKTDWITQDLEGLKAQGLYNRIRTISSPQGAWLVVDGKKVLNFCSNKTCHSSGVPLSSPMAYSAWMAMWPHWIRSTKWRSDTISC